MSRAFAPKDDPPDPPPALYRLPPRSDSGFDAAIRNGDDRLEQVAERFLRAT